MFLCTLRFDMQEEQFMFLKEFFSRDEIEAANEEREDSRTQFYIDPIIDDEEDTQEQEEHAEKTEQPVVFDDESIPLPTQEERNTSIRVSVRARKRLRREDDQYTYY